MPRQISDLPGFIMPTDLARVPDPVASLKRLPAGSAVILRDNKHPQRSDLARELRKQTRRNGQWLLIANDAELARNIDADGVHLAERDVGRIKPLGFTTAACHSLTAIRRAEQVGADALLLSPVLPTASHPGGPVLGLGRARALAATTRLPVYGMGGITPRNAALLGSSFVGFAAIGAFA